MSTLAFLDTETTGLDPDRHEVWEIAWAVENGPVQSLLLPHSLSGADVSALRLNGYVDRFKPESAASASEETALRSFFTGVTLVCSNPSFDTSFLRARWGVEPWRHRKIDIATYAMAALRSERPVGLAKVAERFGVTAPDHTAAGDVTVMRECYRHLQHVYATAFGDAL